MILNPTPRVSPGPAGFRLLPDLIALRSHHTNGTISSTDASEALRWTVAQVDAGGFPIGVVSDRVAVCHRRQLGSSDFDHSDRRRRGLDHGPYRSVNRGLRRHRITCPAPTTGSPVRLPSFAWWPIPMETSLRRLTRPGQRRLDAGSCRQPGRPQLPRQYDPWAGVRIAKRLRCHGYWWKRHHWKQAGTARRPGT